MALLLPALYLRLVASPFGHPSQVCVRKFTFPNLRLLGTPFGQGFKDHGLLLTKLNACGVRGNDLALLSKYLIVRKQYVHIDGCHSSPRTVTARVPQRSILGPILFLLFINDVPLAAHSTVDIYADDTTLSFSSDVTNGLNAIT